jgi:4-hydroxybenzoate polyprenyltransferase
MDAAAKRVLCVDLDGTLVATDLLWESLLSAIRTRPWVLLQAPLWLLRGRPYLKRRLADVAAIDFATLPYRQETVSFVTSEHGRGRRIVLATASDHRLAAGVSGHLGLFDQVLASDGTTNLKGRTKASSLVEHFGEGNFDYIGDSHADIACWSKATDAITVGRFPAGSVPHLRPLPGTGSGSVDLAGKGRAVLRAIRPHQWLKNLLLAVPAVASHQLDMGTIVTLSIAFVSISLCASGGYVLNDLLDLSADRRHPRKRTRPFAAGQLSLATGIAMIATLWVAGFGLAAWLLSGAFAGVLAVYLFGTIAYSVRLKKEPVLDVMFLAGLYVLRVIAGGVAIDVLPSTWLLAFTLFTCLSLAFLKRFIEAGAQPATSNGGVPGRGYLQDDVHWLQSAGLSSAYLSVVVLAIYVTSDDVTKLYQHPERLLLMCPLILYWATRVWLNAHRRRLHDDPLVAVAADPTTYLLLALSAGVILSAVS